LPGSFDSTHNKISAAGFGGADFLFWVTASFFSPSPIPQVLTRKGFLNAIHPEHTAYLFPPMCRRARGNEWLSRQKTGFLTVKAGAEYSAPALYHSIDFNIPIPY